MNLRPYSFPTPNGGLMLSSGKKANGNCSGATAMLLLLTTRGNFMESLDWVAYSKGLASFRAGLGLWTTDTGHYIPLEIDDFISISSLQPPALDIWLRCMIFGYNIRFLFWGARQHVKISAGLPVLPLGRLIWAGSIFLAAREDFSVQDGWCQSAAMILVKRRRGWSSWLGELAIRYWNHKRGARTIASIYQSYCGFEDHPLVEAWSGVEGELK